MDDRKHLSQRAQWAAGESLVSLLVAKELGHPDLISLAVGFVDNETLPIAPIRQAMERIWSNADLTRAALEYGPMFGHLSSARGRARPYASGRWPYAAEMNVGVENVVLMPGSNQLLFLAADVLLDPGDIVSAPPRAITSSSVRWPTLACGP